MNIKFSNFNDWYQAIRRAPKSVQNILFKAYPEYAKQAYSMYQSVIKPTVQTAKDTAKQIATTPQAKQVGATAQKVLGTTAKAAPKVGKLGKVLSTAGKVTPLGIAATVATTGLNYLASHPEKIVYNDNAYKKFEAAHGTPDLPNFTNLAPQLKQLTPEQEQRWRAYNGEQMRDLLAQGKQALADNKQAVAESDTYQAMMDKAIANADNALMGRFNTSLPEVNIPNRNPIPSPNNYSATPPVTDLRQNSIRGYSEPQQGGVNNTNEQVIPSGYQQALIGNIAPSDLIYKNRQAGGSNFIGLQNEVDNRKVPMDNKQPINNNGLQMYSQLLGEQQAQRQALAQQQQQAYENLINQYRQAANQDQFLNATNSLGQGINRYFSEPDRVQYVGYDGGLKTIDMRDPRDYQQVGTPNQDRLDKEMAIRGKQAETMQAAQGGVDPNQIKELMVAQSMANRYGGDPVMYLDKDLAKTYMTGQNTIENTQLKGQQDREMVPLQTLADITRGNYNQANALELEGVKGQNDLRRQALQNEGFINTALINSQSREGIAEMQARNSNAQLQARLESEQNMFNQKLQADLQMLKLRGANERDLIDYRNKAMMNSPMAQAELAIKYATGAGQAMSPSDYANAYQQGLGLLGGEVQAPQLSPSQLQMYKNLGLVR